MSSQYPTGTGPQGVPGSSTLAGDTDVVISSPANGDLLTYDSGSTKWKNKPSSGGGGGGVPTHSNIFPCPTVGNNRTDMDGGGNAFLALNTTYVMYLGANGVVNQAATKCRVGVWAVAGGSATFSAAVLLRTVQGGNTVVDSTPITWGGGLTVSNGGSVGTTIWSDDLTLTIDTTHDYYIMVFTGPSGNLQTGIAFNNANGQAIAFAATGLIAGNQTGVTTISASGINFAQNSSPAKWTLFSGFQTV